MEIDFGSISRLEISHRPNCIQLDGWDERPDGSYRAITVYTTNIKLVNGKMSFICCGIDGPPEVLSYE